MTREITDDRLSQIRASIEIRLSDVDEMRRHGEEHFRAHAAEAEPDMAPYYDPDWVSYYAAEERGQLVIVTAWAPGTVAQPTKVLVGYGIAAVFRSPHYDRIVCQHDMLYVDPEHRGRRIGLRLVQELEAEAVERGARCMLMHAKPGSRLDTLLPRLGYEIEETQLKKEIQ